MIQAILGQKQTQTQVFLEDGTRIPVTKVAVAGNWVTSIKSLDTDGYSAVQLGFGTKKHPSQAEAGITRGAKDKKAPRFLREVRTEGDLPEVGAAIVVADVLKPGDIVDVIGVSKGKGYAGVVKRHNFKGGPRTHGQSDRERAPGSIGQTTTPGRVYKGKRMAGHMGHENVTVRNLEIVEVSEDSVLVKGLVPGIRDSLVIIRKMGESKHFVPLYKVGGETPEEVVVEPAPVVEEIAEKKEEEAVVEEKKGEPDATS